MNVDNPVPPVNPFLPDTNTKNVTKPSSSATVASNKSLSSVKQLTIKGDDLIDVTNDPIAQAVFEALANHATLATTEYKTYVIKVSSIGANVQQVVNVEFDDNILPTWMFVQDDQSKKSSSSGSLTDKVMNKLSV